MPARQSAGGRRARIGRARAWGRPAPTANAFSAVADKNYRDTRDTAVTFAIEAGLTLEQTCSRTLHAPTRAEAVIEKHYDAIRQGVADGAAVKLDAHYGRMGYNFEVLLALPAPPTAAGED